MERWPSGMACTVGLTKNCITLYELCGLVFGLWLGLGIILYIWCPLVLPYLCLKELQAMVTHVEVLW